MVVFEDGLPKRGDYRRFEIKGVPGQDDFASMEEMLRRRFARLAREQDARRSARRFSYPPSLVVVDGGRGQLSVATKVLAEADLHIPAIGLAKRLEEVYFPDRPDPLRIPRGSEALFVLQHLRDEAHRFAITYHRQKRARRALASPLDEVPGVGPARKKALLKRFGSLARLARASVEEIAATPGDRPRPGERDPRAPDGCPGASASGDRMTGDRTTTGRQRGAAHPAPARASRARRPRTPATEGPDAPESNPAFTIITGLSGAGRSEAARCLEDLGYFVVDNLPPTLLGEDGRARLEPRRPGSRRDRPRRPGWRLLRRALAARSTSCDELEVAYADPVPRGLRRGPREPVRGHAPPAPARAGRPRRRGDPQGAAHDGEPARRRRPHHRHVGPHAARAPRADPRRVRRRAARGEPAGLAALVRLQVRRPRATPTS